MRIAVIGTALDRAFFETVTAAQQLRSMEDTLFLCAVGFSDEELERARGLKADCLTVVSTSGRGVDLTALSEDLVRQLTLETVLFPPVCGSDRTAAALACRLGGECILDCVELSRGERREVRVVKAAYASNARVCFTVNAPLCTLVPREKLYSPAVPGEGRLSVRRVSCIEKPALCVPDSVVAFEEDVLGQAELVVVGGRGVENTTDLELVKRFAHALGAAFGASRPLVMSGLAPLSLLIGQSGRTIAPRLCITVGVSGSTPFLAGISPASKLLAINSDPDANIFSHADYGVVEDYRVLLPRLMQSEG